MRAVVTRPGPADRLARSAHPDQWRQLQHGRLDHRCCSLSGGTTLLGESFANNAESSPWILITDRAVASSASSRALAASNSTAFGADLTLAMKALAPGIMVMGIIFFMGTISGAHLNPAVTLAFAVRQLPVDPGARLPARAGRRGGAGLAVPAVD